MAENEKLNILISLQNKITNKLDLEREAATIPEQLHNDTTELERSKARLAELQDQLSAAQDEEKSLSIRYDDANTKHSECQKRFEFAFTQRELEALQKENEEANALVKSLLASRNAKKKDIEALYAVIEEQKEVCDSLQAVVDQESLEVNGKIDSIKAQIEAIDQEINEIKGSVISDEFFEKFYNIAKKKGGEGLVPVKGQVCMGCNTVLPMQFVIDLRIKQFHGETETCPYCSRMIYYDDMLTGAEEKNFLFDDFDLAKNIAKSQDSSAEEKGDEDTLENDELSMDF